MRRGISSELDPLSTNLLEPEAGDPGILPPAMRPPGAYKISSRTRTLEAMLHPSARSARRVRRILESLRDQIVEGGEVRIRRVIKAPREIFRLELEMPELGYQRVTLLDRESLEELLETDDVLERVRSSTLGG